VQQALFPQAIPQYFPEANIVGTGSNISVIFDIRQNFIIQPPLDKAHLTLPYERKFKSDICFRKQ